MITDKELYDLMLDVFGKVGPAPTVLAKVQSVDEGDKTCVLIDDDGGMYEDVRLRPVVDDEEGLTLYPQQGTWALAVRIEKDEEWMVLAFGKLSKWRLSIGEAIVEQDNTGLLIKKQNDSLREVIQLIIESVQQIFVLYGNPPNYAKLSQALLKLQNLLR